MTLTPPPTRIPVVLMALLTATACVAPNSVNAPTEPASAASPDATGEPISRAGAEADVPAIGEIRLFAGTFMPEGWVECDGRTYDTQALPELYEVLGTTYGGDTAGGTPTFRVPALESPIKEKSAGRYIIATTGKPPTYGAGLGEGLQRGMIGEVRLWSTEQNPLGWLPCDGSTLPISLHTSLYVMTFDRFGGDRRGNFRLPNLPSHGKVRYLINTYGSFPVERPPGSDRSVKPADGDRTDIYPMLGTVSLFAGTITPAGWRECDGRTYPTQENMALFSLFGNIYGGDGWKDFGLPKLTFEAEPNIRYIVPLGGDFPRRP